MNELGRIQKHELIQKFAQLVHGERRQTSEIIEYIREIDSRRLYLELGHSNLFAYLTQEVGYTPASAQRRIDAARLLREIPELRKEIESGAINLTQLSVIAQSVRAKERQSSVHVSTNHKREMIGQVLNSDLDQTQQKVAEFLDMEVLTAEKKRLQADKSVRIELTLSQKQYAMIKRAKELISTTHPHAQLNEVLEVLCTDFLERRDPLLVAQRLEKKKKTSELRNSGENAARAVTSAAEVNGRPESTDPKDSMNLTNQARHHLPAAVRRAVFARDIDCQWKDPRTGRKCGSRHHLQVDHIQPIWAHGTDSIENLQLLCGAHNRLKYQRECGIKYLSG